MQPGTFRRRGGATLLAALILLAGHATVEAQEPASALTLDEALDLAVRNNPDYLSQRNDEVEAEWGVREAFGAFLPTAGVSSSLQYQGAGASRFGIFTGDDIGVGSSTSYYLSDYSLSLGYTLSGSDYYRLRQQRAVRSAAASRTDAARFALTTSVTHQYLAGRRADDAVELAEQQLERAEENFRLAEARVRVGAAIPLEAMQAEVERGRAEVQVIRARNALTVERLRLSQEIGVELPADVELTTEFDIRPPRWREEELVRLAMDANPQLIALRAQRGAAESGVRMAQSAYGPRLDASLGWSGFTRQVGNSDVLIEQARVQIREQRDACLLLGRISRGLSEPLPDAPSEAQCAAIALTPDLEQRLLDSNDVFPFDFTRQPVSARLTVSLPVFTGFSRRRQVETARVAAEDAGYRVRAEELRIRTEVTAAMSALDAAGRVVGIEERNRRLAAEQLRLARERYRLGATGIMELLDAETVRAQADQSYLAAVYDFHAALATLEAAVGRSLR